jgi:hypothetical protein
MKKLFIVAAAMMVCGFMSEGFADRDGSDNSRCYTNGKCKSGMVNANLGIALVSIVRLAPPMLNAHQRERALNVPVASVNNPETVTV